MTMTATPVFAQTPIIGIATLTSPTAITARTNITGTTGLTKLTNTSTNGLRVDSIQVKAKGPSVATNVFLWLYDGTTSYLIDEIDISATTPGNTSDSALVTKSMNNGSGLALPATYQLYVSVSVAQDLNILAIGGAY